MNLRSPLGTNETSEFVHRSSQWDDRSIDRERTDGRGKYLFLDGLERRLVDGGKAQQDHVCARVTERPQSIVVLLARSIPQVKQNGHIVSFHLCSVVLEYSWQLSGEQGGGDKGERVDAQHAELLLVRTYVFSWKLPGRESNEQRRLSWRMGALQEETMRSLQVSREKE